LVAGFGGMREHHGELCFSPRLPQALPRLAFAVPRHDGLLRVRIDHTEAAYTWSGARQPLAIRHHGDPVKLPVEEMVTRPVPHLDPQHPPRQPPGRAPIGRNLSTQPADPADPGRIRRAFDEGSPGPPTGR
jgi:alpha,alpha-trehalose phosphorylase